MSVMNDYLLNIAEPNKKELLRICDIVIKTVSDAEESISYGIPAFKYKKRPLLGFSSNKQHLSIYPFSPGIIETMKKKLETFELSKGTIKFSPENPIPTETLQQIIKFRLEEINAATKKS